jgi:DNA polymerase delta subunit 1
MLFLFFNLFKNINLNNLSRMSWDNRGEHESVDSPLIFQTLDWYCEDTLNDSTDFYEYSVYVFGTTLDSKPITVRLKDFYPFFFIEVPHGWDQNCVYTMREVLGKGVKTIEFLKRKKYYGFENNKIRSFLKLTFWNYKSFTSMRWKISKNKFTISGKEYQFQMYESNIDPILRLTHLRDILTAGWVTISNYTFENGVFECSWKSIGNYSGADHTIANFRVLFFDIEACSEDGSFPNALKKNDRVTQICCINKDIGTGEVKKYLFNLGTIDPIEDTIVVQCKSEKKLLLDFAKFINDTNPDLIVGYNIFGFDNGFLFERAKILCIEETFNYQSKLKGFRTDIAKKILNNQQSGFNEWKMTHIVGRIHIDLLQVIKKDFKLESYKLNNVGEHFLKQGKDDVSPKEIFEAWNPTLGTREKRTVVGKYCVQDTNLCLLLFDKFAVLPNHIEMAKVTRVPLEYLITRGQSIKVFSQISYETRKAGYLIPTMAKQDSEGKFQGATVLEAHIGHYTRPVCGLDFASLYPSIMIAHNMCYSTVVLNDRYLNLPGVEYSTIKCNETLSVTFVQNQDGILSGILQSLWKNRKVTKKEMNQSTDPFVKTVLNAKQLAIKVSMNSIYGFTGATVGALPCLEISQSVTGCGRLMIEQTQKHAVEMFQCEIVYGDSVTGDTPVLIRDGNAVLAIEIDFLFDIFESIDYPQFKSGESGLTCKEQSVPDKNIEIWTASGWSPLKRTIRHYCNKNIYRVITKTGIVDVTEDHSLLSKNLEEIKPGNLAENTELFHSFPQHLEKCKNVIFDEKFKTNSKIAIQNKYLEARSYGYQVEIIYNEKDVCCYSLKYHSKIIDEKSVKKIRNLGKIHDFVYDLETADGTFQAGIGQMIVKNTDSCYVIFPQPVDPDGTLTTLFNVAENAAKRISETFKKPIELEFEKFMYPLILVAKKRYMYLEWTDPKHHNGELEAKGVELVRRDNCPYVKETLDAVLTPIMFENNVQLGKEQAEIYIDRLLNGEVPIKKLILSKNLRNDYARPETIAHYQLVEKMKLRDPGSAPKPGDRVPFVYVDIGDPKALSWKKVEDPVYVVEKGIPIDTLYYLEHQVKSPLETIFNILLGPEKCKMLFQRKSFLDAKRREKLSIGESKRKKENNHDIRNFFTLKL